MVRRLKACGTTLVLMPLFTGMGSYEDERPGMKDSKAFAERVHAAALGRTRRGADDSGSYSFGDGPIARRQPACVHAGEAGRHGRTVSDRHRARFGSVGILKARCRRPQPPRFACVGRPTPGCCISCRNATALRASGLSPLHPMAGSLAPPPPCYTCTPATAFSVA